MWEPEGYVVRVAACIHDKYIHILKICRQSKVRNTPYDMYVLRSTVARVGGVMDHGIYVSTP